MRGCTIRLQTYVSADKRTKHCPDVSPDSKSYVSAVVRSYVSSHTSAIGVSQCVADIGSDVGSYIRAVVGAHRVAKCSAIFRTDIDPHCSTKRISQRIAKLGANVVADVSAHSRAIVGSYVVTQRIS